MSYNGTGSVNGLKQVIAREADFAGSDVPPTDGQPGKGAWPVGGATYDLSEGHRSCGHRSCGSCTSPITRLAVR